MLPCHARGCPLPVLPPISTSFQTQLQVNELLLRDLHARITRTASLSPSPCKPAFVPADSSDGEPSLFQVSSADLRTKFFTVRPRRKGDRDPLVLNWAQLEPLAHMPLKDAAEVLGICTSALKNLCRKLGVFDWPYRTFLKQARRRRIYERRKEAAKRNKSTAP
eukprot:1672481-Rhodomonas_salina.1